LEAGCCRLGLLFFVLVSELVPFLQEFVIHIHMDRNQSFIYEHGRRDGKWSARSVVNEPIKSIDWNFFTEVA
jgi:hypothetical protein